MHKVHPEQKSITQNEDFSLADITVVTLRNKGTKHVKYGFGTGTEILKQNETVSFEAGANTVFTSSAVMKIEFISPDFPTEGDWSYVTVTYNRLTEASKAFANLISK